MKKMLFSLMLLAGLTSTAVSADPQMGVQFDQVTQQIATDQPSKIEVMEIFWYGCPHCYHMEQPLEAWVKKLPADVYFKRVPALPNAGWAPMAKAFYAMQELGVLDKLHSQLFDAIHKSKTLNPADEAATIDWVIKQGGLDKIKVEKAFKSFATNMQLNKAMQVFKASGATGVPSLVIDGKYITGSSMAGGNDAALQTADFIINNVRKDKAKK
ncbi:MULTISPECIES: thiol:disulfide interchange protein DsbA/DsbL [unclassified Methylophilus]|uniref:thiol:disulfide interchange protein DsbA/DsbL n=1 Tax=unclassified Methylophilus TaxID=2630143 RepID=UPI0006FB72AF|nr:MULTISPECIES: thiol:disulfide interchange protein DsbA/DsbL [unclassified Methylophilus]KQT41410.1 disulfide bond formation protein DsbA [Methylophilus sp. Leaf416]KQT57931.1 disulfide bond formation protein DsbA [Methylophilus sp. Leaf459]